MDYTWKSTPQGIPIAFDLLNSLIQPLCESTHARPGDKNTVLSLKEPIQLSFPASSTTLAVRKRRSGMFWLTRKVEEHMQNLLMVGQI